MQINILCIMILQSDHEIQLRVCHLSWYNRIKNFISCQSIPFIKPTKYTSIYPSGFVTAVAIFQKPNPIPL